MPLSSFNIFLLQVKKSKKLFLSTIAILVFVIFAYAVSFSPWWFSYVTCGILYILLLFSGIALTTAYHEGAHIRKMEEFGAKVKNLKVHGVGNISFSVEDDDKLGLYEKYQIAAAPFLGKIQYAIEFLVLTLLLLVSYFSPFPLDILLFLVTFFFLLHFLAVIATYVVIKFKKTSGFLVSFSSKLASFGDMAIIIKYNLSQGNRK